MYGKFLYNSILVSLLILLCSAVIIPTVRLDVEKGKLEVTGRIKNEKNKNLDSAKVIIKDSTGRKVLNEYYTDQKGKFSFQLEYNAFVRVYFEKDGYVTMFGTFDTKVPKTKAYKSLYYESAIVLLNDSSNFNKHTAKIEPFMKVDYNSAYGIFIEDLDHTFAFLDQVTEPNIGKLKLTGLVSDRESDSLVVKIEALDSLGRIVAETTTDSSGNYIIEVPLMNKTKLALISENHHTSFAEIEGFVPEGNKEDYFELNHDFIVIPKAERISASVKEIPEDKILYNTANEHFYQDSIVRQNYEYAVEVTKRRLLLSGNLTDPNGGKVVPMDIEVLDGDALYADYKVNSPKYEVEIPYQSIVHVNYKAEGYHPIFVSLNTNMDFDQMDSIKSMTVPVKMYSKDDPNVNPEAFALPVQKFFYDKKTNGFVLDTIAKSDFDTLIAKQKPVILDTSVADGFLILSARVFDPATNGKIESGRVRVLNENKAVVSSMETDKKGKFTTQLGLNKLYYLEFEKEDYYPTLVKFDTKVPNGKENTDITQVGLRAPIVHKENEIAGKPIPPGLMEDRVITAFYFSEEDDLFIEDTSTFSEFVNAVEAYQPPLADVPTPPVDTVVIADNVEEEKTDTIIPPTPTKTISVAGITQNKKNQAIEGIEIIVFENGDEIATALSDENGAFNLNLPPNKKLTAELSKKNYHSTKIDFDTKVENIAQIQSKPLTIPALTLYKENDKNANPLAFNKKAKSFKVDEQNNLFVSEPAVEQSFVAILNTVPDNQKLAIEGKTKNAKGKSIGSALVMVYEGATLVDSVRSDEKGNYELLLPYQKDYRVVIEDDNFYRSYAAVSTKTNNGEERLIDKKVKGLDLIIVNRKEEKINAMAFLKPFSRVRFDSDKDEFVEVDAVESDFIANLYVAPTPPAKEDEEDNKDEKNKKEKSEKEKKEKDKKEKRKKKEVQLETETIVTQQIIASPVLDEDMAPATTTAGIERQQQKKVNRNLAAKNEIMGDFHNMMQGIQGQKVRSMQDVNLDMQRIVNTGYTVSTPPKQEVDESMIKALETRQMLNQIVAEALGFRRSDIPPVSTDSIFDLNLTYRIKEFREGFGIYTVDRSRVYHKGAITEYVHETNWGVFDDYYKNGEEISESVFEKELTALKENLTPTVVRN